MRTSARRGLLAAIAALLAVTGCMTDGPQIDLDAGSATTTTARERDRRLVEAVVGESVTTASGNTVSVLRIVGPGPGAADDSLASIEVEACAREDLDQPVPVMPDQFGLQLSDERVVPALPVGSTEPALERGTLEGGECARGWVSYDLPAEGEPAAVVLAGSSVIRWRIR